MQESEYIQIEREVRRLLGVDLQAYKSQQMQRRLETRLNRSGCVTWAEYFKRLEQDPAERRAFREYLTIKVTSFFRDPDKFAFLAEVILPALLKRRSNLNIWSAGCAHGAEPYALAILLAELTSPYRMHRIVATDVDRSALEVARAGGPYTAEELKTVSPEIRARYFRPVGQRYQVVDELRKKVEFKLHDLLRDPFERDLDLIVCRNVVIYFTEQAKVTLYRRFYEALRPGGVLFVGSTEIVPQARELGFHTIGISFYQKNGYQKDGLP